MKRDRSKELLAAAAQVRSELEAEIEDLRQGKKLLETTLGDRNWEQTIQHLQAENLQLQISVDELEKEREELQARVTGFELTKKETREIIEGLNTENERLRAEFDLAEKQAESLSKRSSIHCFR